MTTRFPGTTIETSAMEKGSSKQLFEGIFAAGGITLSQVSVMTGLEPYLIQNWVKRGFVSSPQKRMYTRGQFARIVIINMLRESLQIEKICNLIRIIGGETDRTDDDLIGDDELYHRYVDLLADPSLSIGDPASVRNAAKQAAEDFREQTAGAQKKLVCILEVMVYAHAAANLRLNAEERLSALE